MSIKEKKKQPKPRWHFLELYSEHAHTVPKQKAQPTNPRWTKSEAIYLKYQGPIAPVSLLEDKSTEGGKKKDLVKYNITE